jgi:glyoxylase-like metal-dependent hydrolase (beta-lactamase superfamily II)
MQRRYKLLLLLVLLIGVPYYWLLIDNHEWSVPERRIDIAELRRLATAVPGAVPDKVVVQDVGWRLTPGTVMVAGGGLKRNNIVVQSFLLSRPGPDILIDSGIAAQDAPALRLDTHVPEKQRNVEAALRGAGLILFTHEHIDHMGGFLRMADSAQVAPRALITEDQLHGESADKLPWPASLREAIRPFRYRGMAAVAPGVVLIRTPGHTPGSQMIFVRLASGREYLFTGDTATMDRSWRLQRGRSRLASDILAPENRAEVLGWLRAIAALKREEPRLVIVPGHDFEHTMDPEHRSGIYYDFVRMEPMPPPARRTE